MLSSTIQTHYTRLWSSCWLMLLLSLLFLCSAKVNFISEWINTSTNVSLSEQIPKANAVLAYFLHKIPQFTHRLAAPASNCVWCKEMWLGNCVCALGVSVCDFETCSLREKKKCRKLCSFIEICTIQHCLLFSCFPLRFFALFDRRINRAAHSRDNLDEVFAHFCDTIEKHEYRLIVNDTRM